MDIATSRLAPLVSSKAGRRLDVSGHSSARGEHTVYLRDGRTYPTAP
jgi:hypothetical protein